MRHPITSTFGSLVALTQILAVACGDSSTTDATGSTDTTTSGEGGSTHSSPTSTSTNGGAGGVVSTAGGGGEGASTTTNSGGAGGTSVGGAGGEGGAPPVVAACESPVVLALGSSETATLDTAAHEDAPCPSADLSATVPTAYFEVTVPAGTNVVVEAVPARFTEETLTLVDHSACGSTCGAIGGSAPNGKARVVLNGVGTHLVELRSTDGGNPEAVVTAIGNPSSAAGTCANPIAVPPSSYALYNTVDVPGNTVPPGFGCSAPNCYHSFFRVEVPPFAEEFLKLSCNNCQMLVALDPGQCADLSQYVAQAQPGGVGYSYLQEISNYTALPQRWLVDFNTYPAPSFANPYIIETISQ